ncbi:hypothetical protein GH714_008992 [Hevea brasiliensis]|uniref:Uncharacterized protein n=1 Tax=Hevea brasiliensis TaxID=3981 RepID=A0A6A6MZP4_HEVBR|nr:hypothetical protein GH714_008992 [Hevea brasiliensis]
MVAKDFILGAVSENSPYREDFDDAEETLSLSDLPLNSNSSVDLDDFSKEYQSSTFDHQDFFEFFSEDSSASITYRKDNNIIFCGKLIPPKEPTVAHHERAKKPRNFHPQIKEKRHLPVEVTLFQHAIKNTSSKQIQEENLTRLANLSQYIKCQLVKDMKLIRINRLDMPFGVGPRTDSFRRKLLGEIL